MTPDGRRDAHDGERGKGAGLSRPTRPAELTPARQLAEVGRQRETPRRPETLDGAAQSRKSAPAEQTLFKIHDKAMGQSLRDAEIIQPGLTAYRKLSGSLGESLYQWERGGRVGLVRDLNVELGNHLRLLDASSPQELASIKTYVTGRGDPRGNYTAALRELLGSRNPHKLDALATRLLQMKGEGDPRWRRAVTGLPAVVAQAESPAEMRAAIVDSAVMRIPHDQVAGVREYVYQRALTVPSAFGLAPNLRGAALEAQANLLALKVQPLCERADALEIRRMARELYWRKFGRRVKQVSDRIYD